MSSSRTGDVRPNELGSAREMLVDALVESLTRLREHGTAGGPAIEDGDAVGSLWFDAARRELLLLSTLMGAVIRYIDASWESKDASEPDDVSDILRAGQLAMVKHPAAAQALFQSFVAEGRRFGATPEGMAWQERLIGSQLIRRGRLLWDSATLNLLEEDSESAIPSGFLDALAAAAAEPDIEAVLARLHRPGSADA